MSHPTPIVVERSTAAYSPAKGLTMKTVLIPLMLMTAGLLMSFAWIGHLKFKSLTFLGALAMSWSMVLPEYILNVYSVRWGRDVFSGAQMAAIHLGSGVVCCFDFKTISRRNSALVSICGFRPYGNCNKPDPHQVLTQQAIEDMGRSL